MRKAVRILGVAVLVGVLASAVIPPQVQAQGESAVPFLLIAPTSRGAGMGEAGTGWIDDASAIFYNPGALAFQNNYEISLTHVNWLPQFNLPDLFYDHLNFHMPVDAISGVVSASVTYLNLGEFTQTSSAGPQEIGKFRAYEYAISAGYSTRAFDDLGLGFNIRFIHSALSPFGTEQEQGNGIASAVAFDIAMMWRPTDLDLGFLGNWGKKLSAGFNISNIGPKIKYVDADQADPLPTNLRLGLGYRLLDDEYNSLQFAFDASRILVHRNDDGTSDPVYEGAFTAWEDGGLKKFILSLGGEYWYGAPKLIAVRIGYFYEHPDYGNRSYLTFGAGIRYDIYGFDFSYISAPGESPLSDTIRFSLLIGWGGE